MILAAAKGGLLVYSMGAAVAIQASMVPAEHWGWVYGSGLVAMLAALW